MHGFKAQCPHSQNLATWGRLRALRMDDSQCLRPLPLLAGGAVLLDEPCELLVVAEFCLLFSRVCRRHFSLRIHFSS